MQEGIILVFTLAAKEYVKFKVSLKVREQDL